MKSGCHVALAGWLGACAIGLAAAAMGQQKAGPAASSETLSLEGLEAGTRILLVTLLEDKRGEPNNGSFVGTVTMLKEDQSLIPFRPFIQYSFSPCFGVGLSYDRVAAEAWDQEGTDGTTVLTGPLVYLLGRYPNESQFTPFCELGVAKYDVRFAAVSGRKNKDFVLEDPQGIYMALGCDMLLLENWSIDFYGRYMNVDVDGDYYLNGEWWSPILFTMSHLSLGAGAKYTF